MRKELFDDAIGAVPPSTVDVDAVMARGRRADRLRRVANPAAAAGVAVVLVTGGIAVTLFPDDGGGASVGTPPPSSTTAPPSSPPTTKGADRSQYPPACDRPDLETAPEVNTRLTATATADFQAQRPDVQLDANPGMEYPDGVARGALEFFQVTSQPGVDGPICDGDNYFMSRATTHAPDGDGNLLVALAPAYGSATTCDDGSTEQTYCDERTGPHGEAIVVATLVLEGGTTMHRLDMTKPDGSQVTVTAENIGTEGRSGAAPTAAAPPLNHQQLIDIALDPGMTLFP